MDNSTTPAAAMDSLKPCQYAVLSQYFETMYKDKLCFKRSADEVHDITDAVCEMAHYIGNKVGKLWPFDYKDQRWEVSKIEFVGSMKDGSRNCEPDEFDFIYVIKSLSSTNDVQLAPGCTADKGGHVHIDIRRDSVVSEEWKDITVVSKLISNRGLAFDDAGLRQKFCVVISQIHVCESIQLDDIEKPRGCLTFNGRMLTQSGPACTPVFTWVSNSGTTDRGESLSIHVDITPAILFSTSEHSFDGTCTRHDYQLQAIRQVGSFMAIPTSSNRCGDNRCFKITHTVAELKAMEKLTPLHRTCYQILKYMFSHERERPKLNIAINSYSLKTIILRHQFEARCPNQYNSDVSRCILECLQAIRSVFTACTPYGGGSTMELFLPCPLSPSQNIYANGTVFLEVIHDKAVLKLGEIYSMLEQIITDAEQEHRSGYSDDAVIK